MSGNVAKHERIRAAETIVTTSEDYPKLLEHVNKHFKEEKK